MAEIIGPSGLRRVELEGICAEMGHILAGAVAKVAPGCGFALLVYDFGEKGNMAFVSNAQRPDMIRALDELLEKLRAETQ